MSAAHRCFKSSFKQLPIILILILSIKLFCVEAINARKCVENPQKNVSFDYVQAAQSVLHIVLTNRLPEELLKLSGARDWVEGKLKGLHF